MQQTVKKQSVVLFYVRVFLYTLVALLIRAAAFAPLAALFVFPAESSWRWLWTLCPLLVIFLVLPLRFSFADALIQRPRQRYFSLDQALSLRDYGEKLWQSVLHALSTAKWALPLAALGVWGWYLKEQSTLSELLESLKELGQNVTNLRSGFVNFVRNLFGHLPLETVEGSYMQGLYVMLGVVALAALVFLYGVVRNSATRYIWAVANREDRPVHREIRRRLRGRRGSQLGVALVNLLLCAPFLTAAWALSKDTFFHFTQELVLSMTWNGIIRPNADVVNTLIPLALAFLGLYLPLLPTRRILTASFATRELRRSAPRSPEAQHEEVEGMPAAIVPDWVRAENEKPSGDPQAHGGLNA